MTKRNGHDARIGPKLPALARAAGFDDFETSRLHLDLCRCGVTGVVGRPVADRIRYSRIADQAVEYGLSDPAELESIAAASCVGRRRPTPCS